jgi:hypothetical protein
MTSLSVDTRIIPYPPQFINFETPKPKALETRDPSSAKPSAPGLIASIEPLSSQSEYWPMGEFMHWIFSQHKLPVMWATNCKDFREVKLLCIGTIHDKPEIRKTATVISQIFNPQKVLHEGDLRAKENHCDIDLDKLPSGIPSASWDSMEAVLDAGVNISYRITLAIGPLIEKAIAILQSPKKEMDGKKIFSLTDIEIISEISVELNSILKEVDKKRFDECLNYLDMDDESSKFMILKILGAKINLEPIAKPYNFNSILLAITSLFIYACAEVEKCVFVDVFEKRQLSLVSAISKELTTGERTLLLAGQSHLIVNEEIEPSVEKYLNSSDVKFLFIAPEPDPSTSTLEVVKKIADSVIGTDITAKYSTLSEQVTVGSFITFLESRYECLIQSAVNFYSESS